MKLLFSDLDGTIVFNRKTIHEHVPLSLLQTVDSKGQYKGVMLKELITDIQDFVSQGHLFIPSTMRTMHELTRITSSVMRQPFTIANNGATVLLDGQIDQKWDKKVKKDTSLYPTTTSLFNEINKKNIPGIIGTRDKEWYVLLLVENEPSIINSILQEIQHYSDTYGYCITCKDDKIYIMPQEITKGFAANYIIEKNSPSFVLSALDAFLDQSLFDPSDRVFIPKNSEIDTAEIRNNPKSHVSQQENIASSSELCQLLRQLV